MRTSNAETPLPPRRGWKKVLGGLVAAALFLPMPALALTFMGSWQITQNQTGGAPRAEVTFGDRSTGGFLNINMGSYSARRVATSQVTAVRTFSVSSPREMVTITRTIQTILKNAFTDVSVEFQRISGSTNITFPRFTRKVGSRPRFFDEFLSRRENVNRGTYRVTVRVRQTKDLPGSWTTVSPYQFTFDGVRGASPHGPDPGVFSFGNTSSRFPDEEPLFF